MKSKIIFIVFISIFFTSCVSVRAIRHRIKREHPEVQDVGILKKWHGSKYLALDIVYYDGRRLFITWVGRNLKPPFNICRIGEYTFNTCNLHSGYPFHDSVGFGPAQVLAQELEIPIKTVHDVIRGYNQLYAYMVSLPDINDEIVLSEKARFDNAPNWAWLSDIEFKQVKYGNELYIFFKDKWTDYQYEGRRPQYQ
jgi:hypothetical protein